MNVAAASERGDVTARAPAPAPAANGIAIETHELRKQFGRTQALADLTMTVRRGEVFGFLGPNGAGKTTAVKLLLGLSRPSGGRGTVLGAPLGDVAARRRIGYLPELFRYQAWMTASEVLALHCELAGLPHGRWAAEIRGALELVGLAQRDRGRVGSFSKGMQQRLGLGVALLGSPDLVLLDEPTSALDPVGRQDVRNIIGALRERGVTVFLNSHLLGEVERVCDRVAIVDRGRVVAEVGMAELLVEQGIRIRVSGGAGDGAAGDGGAGTGLVATAGRWGRARLDGEWLFVDGVADADVPALVAALVGAGAAIHAVMPVRHSLEERFMALLGAGSGSGGSGTGGRERVPIGGAADDAPGPEATE